MAIRTLLFAFISALAASAEPAPRYQLTPLPDDQEQIACAWDQDQLSVLEKLNRCDRTTLFQRDRIVVPETWLEHELDYAPVPRNLEWARQSPQVVVVHKPLQVFAAYEEGRLVRWGPSPRARRRIRRRPDCSI